MSEDWLAVEEDPARVQAALDFAQLYVAAFVTNAAGAAILSHWDGAFARKRTPVNAPHTEYAANEAMRAFVEGIHEQIRFAQQRAV